MKPYQLADGRFYQDVVSIGADAKGAAPTVTMVSTYALGHAKKNGRIATCGKCSHQPVVAASASQTGVWNILIAGAAAKAVSTSGTTIYNTNSQTQSQTQNQMQ